LIRSVTFAAMIALAAAVASGVSAAASGGALDRTFGDNGIADVEGVTSCLTGEGGCNVGIGLAIGRDGAAIAAAGTLEPDCRSQFAIVRLRGGRLDPSFGRGGRVLTGFGSSAAIANAVALTAGGKIVVVGEHQPAGPSCGDHIHLGHGDGFALARYHRDGRLDTSFGGDGTTFTPLPEAAATDVLLQRDGKIVAVGSTRNGAALARYTREGELDRSFGRGGVVPARTSERYVEVGRPALDGLGRIILPMPGPSASVLRYTRDGTLDRSFGNRGRVLLPFVLVSSVEVTREHGIFVVGRGIWGFHDGRVAAVRLSAAGKLVPRFGRDGIALAALPTGSWVYDAAIDASDKLVVLAHNFLPGAQRGQYLLSRLTPNGLPDRSFGTGGLATVELGKGGGGRRVALQRDGKLVVASMTGNNNPPVLTVTRHLP
jgi:uncharacterized delta-60 repeat protein